MHCLCCTSDTLSTCLAAPPTTSSHAQPPSPWHAPPRSFFMLLLYLVNVALVADNPKRPYALENRNPAVEAVGGLPPCEDNPLGRTPCWVSRRALVGVAAARPRGT